MGSGDVAPLPVGVVLYGYRIDKVLGQGGFGITYLSTKLDTNQVYVIKENIPGTSARRSAGELQFHWVDDGDKEDGVGSKTWSEENFIREATNLSRLKHRGIVAVSEAFRSAETGSAYYTMTYVSPNSLSHVLRKKIKRNKEWVAYLLASLLDSLKYVHSMNVLHRDIKPENILIANSGEPVIIDFGSARATEVSHKTRIVSVNYSPIEQMRGSGEGPWTDLYALAASIYQVITNEYVPQLACRGGKKDEYVPLASRQDLVQIFGTAILSSLDKALAFEPEDRYQSADEWIQALAQEPAFQFIKPILPPTEEKTPAPTILLGNNIKLTPTPARKSKTGLIVAIIVIMLMLLGGGICTWLFLLAPKETPEIKDTGKWNRAEVATTAKKPELKPAPEAELLRIIARPDIRMYDEESKTPMDKTITPFSVYYSHGVKEGYHRVSERPERNSPVLGLFKEEDVHEWPYNLVIDFSPQGGMLKRDRALFFNSANKAQTFITETTSPQRRDLVQKAIEATQGTEHQDLESEHGVVAIEPVQWGGSYRLLPVLDYMKTGKDAQIGEFNYNDVDGQISSYVLKISAMTEKRDKVDTQATQVTKKVSPDVDLVFVVDTTKSMGPYIDDVRRFIGEQASKLDELSGGKIRFGLVAYRDWKHKKNGGEDTEFLDYVVKNYNSKHNSMMTIHEFQQNVLELKDETDYTKYDLRETTEDSIDCCEDVFSGIHEAIFNMPWRDKGKATSDHNLRFVILIGDAPGRLPGEKEDNALRFSNPEWKNRPTGSYCMMDDMGISSLLKENHIFLQSYFILTPMPKGLIAKAGKSKSSKRKYEKVWDNYLKEGVRQFKSMSYSDSGDALGKCCTLIPSQGFLENGGDITQFGVDTSGDFLETFANAMTEFSKLVGEGIDVTEQDADASAAKSLFAGAYVDWFSKQKPSEGEKLDMQGWTQSTNDTKSEMLQAKVVLSRKQVEQIVQKMQVVIDSVKEQGGEAIDSALEGIVSQMYSLVADPNVKNNNEMNLLKKAITTLPYKSNLLRAVENDAFNDDASKNELFKTLNSRVRYMQEILRSSDACIPDPTGDSKQDLFLIPIDMLP